MRSITFIATALAVGAVAVPAALADSTPPAQGGQGSGIQGRITQLETLLQTAQGPLADRIKAQIAELQTRLAGQGSGAGQGAGQSRPADVQRISRSLFAGNVTAVGSDSLTVNVQWSKSGSASGSVTVAVNADTKLNKGEDGAITLADVKIGDLVGVGAVAAADGSLTAKHVRVAENTHWIGGTVASIDGSTLTVQVLRTGPYDIVLKDQTVKIGLSADTVFVQGRDRKPITAADVKAGDKVGVLFSASGFFRAPGFDWTTATLTAKTVRDWKKVEPQPATAGSQRQTSLPAIAQSAAA